MINPCKDCANQGCGSYHDECKKYLEWQAERNLIHERKNKKNKTDYDFYEQTINRLSKSRRKK